MAADRTIGDEIKSIDAVSALKLLGITFLGYFGIKWIQKKFEKEDDE